jgi:hypothetical protein
MFKHYETATGNQIKIIQSGKEVLFSRLISMFPCWLP